MKTLYISDLDGTLLRCDRTLSAFTADAINTLTEKGMVFSYATARSAQMLLRMTKYWFSIGVKLFVKSKFVELFIIELYGRGGACSSRTSANKRNFKFGSMGELVCLTLGRRGY